jgi:phosphate/sulfate permease
MEITILISLWIGFALLVGVVGKNREIGFGGAIFFSILLSPLFGLIIALLSKTKKALNEEHKFLAYKELGKKAEFKGHIDEAIDHYMDALYHLENDYNHLPKKLEDGRLNHLKTIKEKIDNLKKTKSEQVKPI